jgi:maltose alpha-D-glucosyltransferase/alpha-amylase
MSQREIDGIRDGVREYGRTTLELVSQDADALPAAAQQDVARLLANAKDIDGFVDGMRFSVTGGLRTRYHGDYHLGQVLVSRNDFYIIDFEGEPARPLDERRAKHSPLRDVAGMVRSFDYARWTALRRTAQNADELVRLAGAATEWKAQTVQAFMDGYTHALDPALGPIDPQMLSLFELEKAYYELRYEINNRPDWLSVPLQGILAMVAKTAR